MVRAARAANASAPPPKLAMKRVLVLSISPAPSRSRGWGRWVQPYATFQVGGWAELASCVAAKVPPRQKNTTLVCGANALCVDPPRGSNLGTPGVAPGTFFPSGSSMGAALLSVSALKNVSGAHGASALETSHVPAEDSCGRVALPTRHLDRFVPSPPRYCGTSAPRQRESTRLLVPDRAQKQL